MIMDRVAAEIHLGPKAMDRDDVRWIDGGRTCKKSVHRKWLQLGPSDAQVRCSAIGGKERMFMRGTRGIPRGSLFYLFIGEIRTLESRKVVKDLFTLHYALENHALPSHFLRIDEWYHLIASRDHLY